MVPSYLTRPSVWTTPLYGRLQETRTRAAIIREEAAVDEHAAGVASAAAALEPTMEGIRWRLITQAMRSLLFLVRELRQSL
jgi:hypothetical protein